MTDTAQGTVRYRYDKAHRIAEETLPDSSRRAFGYDPAGNLRSQPGLTDVEMDSGNRLRAANRDNFTYNDRDHLSVREGRAGTTRYEYNTLDMLVRCEINGEIWTASYDALCRRIRKTWRGRTSTYYWDDFRLAAEVRHDGSLRLYLYEDDVALVPFMFVEYDSPDSEPASGKRYYIFTNQIGVPIRVEDDSGRSCWSARIDPYGLAQLFGERTVEMPLRFPGHYYDSETGLHYNRFRYFSPELGCYVQSDPAGIEGGINLYAYPINPLTGADIDGLGRKRGRASGKEREGTRGETGAGCPFRQHPGGKDGKQQPQLDAEKRATEIRADIPEEKRPKVVCIVRDKRTGKTYEGLSGKPDVTPNDAHEKLGMPKNSLTPDGRTPGRCAEPKAIDAALKDGANKRDLQVATINVADGKPKECCANCKVTTKKTTVLTDP